MHIRLVAVGDKQPSWVDTAFSDYVGRLPRQWKFRLDTIAAGQRTKSSSASNAMEVEGRKVLARIRPDDFVVLLDERGETLSSRGLGERLGDWQSAGRDLCFLIGVMFGEQLYRAWTLTQGHPYHRD